MEQEFELIAKTFMGLEPVLAKELTQLGANNVQIGRRMVSFTGDKEMMYRANFSLHTAIRVIKPIKHFKAQSADDVYEEVKKIDWSQYLDLKKSFAVDSVVFSDEFRHSKFVSYKVKDAIVDQFREKTGQRPNISVANPDIRLNMHIAEDRCTLSLDSSGESLHRRGYRQESVEAPLNEVLAAGMILMTGWHGETDFIDPMCGSGTLLVEAALIALNIPPGIYRKEFAFERWKDFNEDLFDTLYNDDSHEHDFPYFIYGSDISPLAIKTAEENVRAAGLSRYIKLKVSPLQKLNPPASNCLIVTNPPYGERITSDNIFQLYADLGTLLKHHFAGSTAWVISSHEECLKCIGLKPSKKIRLLNGDLECQYCRYDLFEGKRNEYLREREEWRGRADDRGDRRKYFPKTFGNSKK